MNIETIVKGKHVLVLEGYCKSVFLLLEVSKNLDVKSRCFVAQNGIVVMHQESQIIKF